MKSLEICYNQAQLADRFLNYQKMNIFTKFYKLAMQIIKSTTSNHLSAQPPQGNPVLLNSFKNFIQPLMNYKIDSDKQIAISHGATQALAGAIQALVDPGDEVIIIDPSFDIYRPQVEFCGGKCRGVHLRPKKGNSKKDMMNRSPNFQFQRDDDDWEIDWKEFSEALNDRTKAILINTPHNPTGKIFTKEEINEMAKALEKYPNVWIISDEAYSHICFEPYKPFQHPRAIEHPKLKDRTVSIFSIGKLFSSSGLRLGACVGNEQLINAITVANQADMEFLNSPFQQGAALSFDFCANSDYFQNKSNEYFGKAQGLLEVLTKCDINLGLWMPEGGSELYIIFKGYFAMSEISQVQIPDKYYNDPDSGHKIGKDSAFVYWLADTKKVVAIPLQSFYAPEKSHENLQYVRWAFCKGTETLNNARQRLLV